MPDLSTVEPLAWGLLAGSILAAVLLDFVCVRFMMELLRPASVYGFVAGRAGKILSFLAWLVFLTNYWLPNYLQLARSQVLLVRNVGLGIVLLLAVLAFVTLPRPARAR